MRKKEVIIPEPTQLLMSRIEVANRIKEHIDSGEAKIVHSVFSNIRDECTLWNNKTDSILKSCFSGREILMKYEMMSHEFYNSGTRDDKGLFVAYLNSLKGVYDVIDLYQEAVNVKDKMIDEKKYSSKVFIVHGHDDLAKTGTARLVEKLGFEAIVLHEQPNLGKTIIEKFEAHADDVGFAIILLTPDDLGEAKDKIDNPKPRARQNVVLELGFFIGKLGRGRVAVLHKGHVELPSDIMGVVYTEMDMAGRWQFDIAKEMKAAGYSVDLNRL